MVTVAQLSGLTDRRRRTDHQLRDCSISNPAFTTHPPESSILRSRVSAPRRAALLQRQRSCQIRQHSPSERDCFREPEDLLKADGPLRCFAPRCAHEDDCPASGVVEGARLHLCGRDRVTAALGEPRRAQDKIASPCR